MNQLSEATSRDQVVKAVSTEMNMSQAQAQELVDGLSADDYINLVSAVDSEDWAEVDRLASTPSQTVDAELDADTVESKKARLKEIGRDQNLNWATKQSQSMSIISSLTNSDWRLVYPALDKEFLRKLYQSISDQFVPTVDKAAAQEIWSAAKDTLSECVIYENQVVPCLIPNGPEGTVGILWEGNLKMVHKTQTRELSEHVLGMTQMPNLARIRELAGLGSAPVDPGAPQMVVVVDVDPSNPLDLSSVGLPDSDQTMLMRDLRTRIRSLCRQINAELSSDAADYDGCWDAVDQLHKLTHTMIRARQDLDAWRSHEGG